MVSSDTLGKMGFEGGGLSRPAPDKLSSHNRNSLTGKFNSPTGTYSYRESPNYTNGEARTSSNNTAMVSNPTGNFNNLTQNNTQNTT